MAGYTKRLSVRLFADGALSTLAAIDGDDNDNQITGTELADAIQAFGGADVVYAFGGDDSIDGGIGDDWLHGDGGSDTLIGGAGSDALFGLRAHSPLDPDGVDAADFLDGGDGQDALYGNAGDDTLLGGDGDDHLREDAGNDLLDGGSGIDRASYRFLEYDAPVVFDASAVGTASEVFLSDGRGGTDHLIDIEGVVLIGANQDDVLIGSVGDDVLSGLDGDDALSGGAGDDELQPDAGDDTIDGGTGEDWVNFAGGGESGVAVDLRIAGPQDTGLGLDTFAGIEHLRGSVLSDTLTGSAGTNRLYGGISGDRLYGVDGDDVLDGEDGDDTLDGGSGADTMIGGSGDDLYFVDDVGDYVLDDGGSDRVYARVDCVLQDGIEQGRIYTSAPVDMTGNALSNLITAGAGDNVIHGMGGTDTVSYATAGRAVKVSLSSTVAQATGGSGSDRLLSIERLIGSNYGDNLSGSSSANTLNGGAGNDVLDGASGIDTMLGGVGDDRYYVDNLADVVIEATGGGTDTVFVFATHTLSAHVENGRILSSGTVGLSGNSLANVLYAGAGSNRIAGGDGVDTVSYAYADAGVRLSLAVTSAQATGGSGSDSVIAVERATGSAFHDRLSGSALDNVLRGGAGNDTLDGAGGRDTLAGGAGNDTFRFTSALSAASNVDVVSDFSSADDRFALSRGLFGQAGVPGTLMAEAFRLGTSASDSSDRIVYDRASGKLYYDADGTGAAAQVLFATVAPGTAVVAGDFVLV